MKKGFWIISLVFPFFFYTSCTTVYQPQSVEFYDYRVKGAQQQDSVLVKLLKPYADSVNLIMNEVIAHVGTSLEKKQPEGTLGNVVADAMLETAKEIFKQNVDVAFMNSGGLRLNQISAGPLTRGKVFELSPFDNFLVLLTMNGKTLQQFLDHVASKKGWPVSGLTMQIKEDRAINVLINGKPIDENSSYTIATIDYLANGGENSNMLVGLPVKNGGYFFRDVLIEYFSKLNNAGKQITSKLGNRITVIP